LRTAFIDTLCELAGRNSRVWLLCGDLGYSVLEKFAERFPERYLNVGVAEQNLAGIASGLAFCGKSVFIYSIANFPVMRCLEQIRNDICYHNLNVKIVAVGGGLAYGPAGYTHHAVEDFAVLRAMPNMTLVAPADPAEARLATRAIAEWEGPCYLRLGKAGEPVVHATDPAFRIGRAIPVREGGDLTLISTGGTLRLALGAAERLGISGRATAVISMPTVSPLDEEAVLLAAHRTGRVITVEEHGVGGLASAVAEVLLQSREPVRFAPVRLGREPLGLAGSQAEIAAAQGVSKERIIETALSLFDQAPARASH